MKFCPNCGALYCLWAKLCKVCICELEFVLPKEMRENKGL
jgi:hypothetical protein